MKNNKFNKEIYFVHAPFPTSYLKFGKDSNIIDALNRILELSFSKAKTKDFIIHFVDKRATKIILAKKYIKSLIIKMNFSTTLG